MPSLFGTGLNPTPGTSVPTLLLRSGLHGTGCVQQAHCPSGDRVLAIPIISPVMRWLGGQASKVIGDVWQAAMTGLWSAALWLLRLSFSVIDQFTTPDLSGSGPMGSVLPTTLWIGAAVAGLMMTIQLVVALVRRDGQSLGRVFLGIGQFGAVWLAFLGVGAGLVAAAAGLEHGILAATVHAQTFSNVDLSASWPRNVNDVVLATVLGILSLLMVMPAAFFFLVIMFVREAALILLVATAPISAAGLLADASKVWFWKTLRWFIACVLISPTCALVLGIGVRVSQGVVSGQGDKTSAAAGMAVVGCVIIAIGACCPLVLFRLLSFVDPSSASGAALRQSWSDAGGLSGVIGGNASPSSSGSAATQTGADGRSGGESAAESQTRSRLSTALGSLGTGLQTAVTAAHKAADIGSDVLGSGGVGHPGYSLTDADTRATSTGGYGTRPDRGGSSGGGGDGGSDGGPPDAGGPTPSAPGGPDPSGPDPATPTPLPPQPSGQPPHRQPGAPGGGGPGGASGAGGASGTGGAGAGGAAASAVVV